MARLDPARMPPPTSGGQQMEYLGTDVPPEQPPMITPTEMGGMEDAMGGDPYENDAAIIAEAAMNYMGVDINTAPPEEIDQILTELQAGYPDDARLQEALQRVSSAGPLPDPGAPPGPPAPAGQLGASQPMPEMPPPGTSFRPDRPLY